MEEKKEIPRPGADMKPEEYEKYVKRITPVHNTPLNMVKAFLTGGIICTIGQFFMNIFTNNGLEKDAAGAWTLLILIGSTVILTGLNIFPKIVSITNIY
ncbi:MAG: SpoVA/SpoVAEb family sporulation membrane protein, partial [Lachnospiraceae bacterium]|nr:SpoVA/SpoVAEb family sporulation membrane protein [Lachnospiraceae bacterium]